MGLSSGEDGMIVAWVVLAWYRTVTDRRSDGRWCWYQSDSRTVRQNLS